MALVLIGARIAIEHYAERIISRELTAASRMFQRFASMRYDQMEQAAQVLAADFGFRAAVATRDGPTIESALVSLKTRLGISHAFLVDLDGNITGLDEQIGKSDVQALWHAVDNGSTHGVLQLGKYDYRAGAAPVKLPDLAGWVVFANRLDDKEMASLTNLSSIPLEARIVPLAGIKSGIPVVSAGLAPATERDVNGERILFQASPIEDFSQSRRQALVLEYSLSDALSEYDTMFWTLFGLALAGVGVTVGGSWYISRRLARPIEALDRAARRVSAGEHVQVDAEADDEIGRLASSFNMMVNDIAGRERQIMLAQFEANAKLESSIHKVQLENVKLNELAQEQRHDALYDAALTLENELAPLLISFEEESKRLKQTSTIMRDNLYIAKDRASVAATSAESTGISTRDMTFIAEQLELSGRQIASEASSTSAFVTNAAEGSAAATRSFTVLRVAVDEIGDVTDEIREISRKTNMLALNASIEAARAGEMGLSFSAVAREVKDLAKITASLTTDIGSRLTLVGQAMRDADAAIVKVDEALVVAGGATSAIAVGAVQQSKATSTISESIASIARDTQSVAEAIMQVDTAAVESKEAAEQVGVSAYTVAERAVVLRETLDKFIQNLRQSA